MDDIDLIKNMYDTAVYLRNVCDTIVRGIVKEEDSKVLHYLGIDNHTDIDVKQNYIEDNNPMRKENKYPLIKPISEFERFILNVKEGKYNKDEYQLTLNTSMGSYMGDHGIYRKIYFTHKDSGKSYGIEVFINIFMSETPDPIMMQMLKKDPLAARNIYHNNQVIRVVRIEDAGDITQIQYPIYKFESDELKDYDFEETIIGLTYYFFGEIQYDAK